MVGTKPCSHKRAEGKEHKLEKSGLKMLLRELIFKIFLPIPSPAQSRPRCVGHNSIQNLAPTLLNSAI